MKASHLPPKTSYGKNDRQHNHKSIVWRYIAIVRNTTYSPLVYYLNADNKNLQDKAMLTYVIYANSCLRIRWFIFPAFWAFECDSRLSFDRNEKNK